MTYDLPSARLRVALRGRYRGQRQGWFAQRFTKWDSNIRLDLHPHSEFDARRWAELDGMPALVVYFNRSIYEALVRAFAER